MIERKRGCPAIVATRNDHALPSRFLLAGLRPARMVHGTSGSALTFARCTRSLIHMKRLRVFQTFVHSVFSRALRARSHGMRDQSPALFTKTSHGIDDRPHSRSAGLLTDRFALRLLTGLRPVRIVRGTSGPALFTFEALPTSSRGVAARMVCETRGLALVAPRRQRAPPHASWPVRSDTLLPDTDRSGE